MTLAKYSYNACNTFLLPSGDQFGGLLIGGNPRQWEISMNRMAIRIMTALNTIKNEDRGGVAAEYGVLLAGIVGVVAIAAAALGGRIGGLFDSILP